MTNNMKKLIYFASIAIFLLSSLASADDDYPDVLEHINNSFFGGITVMHLNYKETFNKDDNVPGSVEEFGWSYGLGLNFRNVFYDRLYTDVYGEFTTGKIQYDGYTQATRKPLKKKESHNFANIDAKLGDILLNTKYFQIIPYGGLGFRYWTPLNIRTYYNFKAYFGTKINCVLFDDLVLSPYANIGTTLYSHAKYKAASYSDGTSTSKTNHSLGNKMLREIGLEINYRMEHELFVTGMISHTRFSYGRSVTQGGYAEPNSTTNELRFVLGIRYGFA